MFLARKITRAKWGASQGLTNGEISADAVTGDLRTHGDMLSFWQCDTGTNGDVEEAALAIAAAGERVDKLDIVWLADDKLRADGQTLKDTKGRTPVSDLADRHIDVCQLDYVRLGKIADCVVAAIEDKRCRRLTKQRVKEILSTAVGQDRINLERLADGLRAEIAG